MSRRHALRDGGLALLLGVPLATAQAATCTVAASPVAFGNYDPAGLLALDSAGQVSVTCSNTLSLLLSYNVSLSQGASARYDFREMASGSNRLRYNLYTDVTRLLIWGDGSPGTTRVSNTYLVTIGGVTANHAVYGRVPAGQNAAVGSYSDSITVTIEY